jgi:hypothetical protein
MIERARKGKSLSMDEVRRKLRRPRAGTRRKKSRRS